tara:strand:+ start:441 stop:689 length:249 start_codon:yes stop_codon:yes gene_type:complete
MNRKELNVITGEETIIELTPEEVAAVEARGAIEDAKANHYINKRLKEYPSAVECVHALLDGGATLTELQELRATIKAKYPKN